MSPPKTFSSWRDQAQARLLAQYCIDLNDAGLDDDRLRQEFALSTDPSEFVEFIARKFDLTSRHDVRTP